MPVNWTDEMKDILKQHKILVDKGTFVVPKVHTYRKRPHEPNASLEYLVAKVNNAIHGSSERPSNVAVQIMYHRMTGDRHDSAKYQTDKRTREDEAPAAKAAAQPAVEPAQKPTRKDEAPAAKAAARPAVQPAQKRTREEERAEARVKRAAFEASPEGIKISAYTDEEKELLRQWRNAHPHDTSKWGSPSDDLLKLSKTMKRTPDAIYRRLPAAQTEGESAGAAVRPAPQQTEGESAGAALRPAPQPHGRRVDGDGAPVLDCKAKLRKGLPTNAVKKHLVAEDVDMLAELWKNMHIVAEPLEDVPVDAAEEHEPVVDAAQEHESVVDAAQEHESVVAEPCEHMHIVAEPLHVHHMHVVATPVLEQAAPVAQPEAPQAPVVAAPVLEQAAPVVAAPVANGGPDFFYKPAEMPDLREHFRKKWGKLAMFCDTIKTLKTLKTLQPPPPPLSQQTQPSGAVPVRSNGAAAGPPAVAPPAAGPVEFVPMKGVPMPLLANGDLDANQFTTEWVQAFYGVQNRCITQSNKLRVTAHALNQLRAIGALTWTSNGDVSVFGISSIAVTQIDVFHAAMLQAVNNFNVARAIKKPDDYLYDMFNVLGFDMEKTAVATTNKWILAGRPKKSLIQDKFTFKLEAFGKNGVRFITGT